MQLYRKRLGDLLISQRLLTPEQLEQALALQRKHYQPLGQILVQNGLLTEKRLLQACALQNGVSAWHFQDAAPAPEALALLPAELCRRHVVLPVQASGGRMLLAMKDTGDVEALDIVRQLSKMRVEPVLAGEERLREAIDAAYGTVGGSRSTADSMTRLVMEALGQFQMDGRDANSERFTEAELRPLAGLVNQILLDAVRLHASDIHIEPRKDRIEIRYRIDGRLCLMHELPSRLLAALTARLKIMAQLDIVEYRIPQDGRTAITADGRTIDLRVSVLPNYHGQRVVLRILDKGATLRSLGELGFAETNLRLFQDIIHKPYGLVLVTGPTGSGKTTTLYAAINQLKEISNNIMTCEDPVEYDIDGINQSHVNEKVGLTFAVQLRAILRQDPDIVLVGEIRDKETAETAIRAALTGHLVLSTLHCNNAASAIPRLTDMGIEPFLLSTALIGITAQRLVRMLCPHCKAASRPTPEECSLLGCDPTDPPTLWQAAGCDRCGQNGYHGRLGVHEVFPVAPEMQRMIAACETVEALQRVAGHYGYRSMAEDACARVLAGQTSLTEVQRLVFFDTLISSQASPHASSQASSQARASMPLRIAA